MHENNNFKKSLYSNVDYYNNLKNAFQKQNLIMEKFYNTNLINENYSKLVNDSISIYTPPDYTNLFQNNVAKNLSDIISKVNFTIPDDIVLNNITKNIEQISSAFNKIYSLNFEEVSTTDINSFISMNYDFKFPNNISIAEMESIINDEELENEDFDLDEFNREIALINFSTDLPNVLNHFVIAFTMASHYIDNSIKEKLYQTMIEGIIELIGKGMAVLAIFVLFVVLNYYLKDCFIYKHFIELCKEAKNTFKN